VLTSASLLEFGMNIKIHLTKMAKKKIGSVHTCKNGATYKIMPNGRARFLTGPTKRKSKGGSIRVGGGVSVGGAVRKKRKRKKY
jgi:hypothetical protein